MELTQLISQTEELSRRYHELVGPWERNLYVTHLNAVVGRLADDVMIMEGKLPFPLSQARLARNIADAIIQLIRLSQSYQLDLELALNAFLAEGQQALDDEELVTTMLNILQQNRIGGQANDNK